MCKAAAFLGKLIMGIVLVCTGTALQAQVRGDGTCTIEGTYRIEDLFTEVRRQTGVHINFEQSVLSPDLKVKVSFKKATPEEVVEKITRDQRLTWIYVKGQIVIKEGDQPAVVEKKEEETVSVTGFVTDTLGNPLPGSTVIVKGTLRGTTTGENGRYVLEKIPPRSTLVVLSIGYLSRQYRLDNEKIVNFHMEPNVSQIAAVEVTSVATGYQTLSKARTTGSFVLIDSALLNRNPSPNILDRLEGVTSGLLTFRTQAIINNISKMPTGVSMGMTLRGMSTLSQNRVNTNPLIVLDNFPYEGDIRNINPNDIESISVLKDAAAASIWGARSGNGVLVLTSKRGKYNQKMKTDFNMNFTIGAKPDLHYSPNYMSAADYIEVERLLFDRGYFNGDLSNRSSRPVVTPVVEILAKQRSGAISAAETEAALDELKKNDLRSEFDRYSYQNMINQQYSVGVRGGTKDFAYYISLGHDRSRDNLKENGRSRTTIISSNTFRPVKKVEVNTYLNFSQNRTDIGNDIRYGGVSVESSKYGFLYPYARLADDSGNALAVAKNYRMSYADSMTKLGFLDWRYRPLDEINNKVDYVSIQNLVLRASIKYKIAKFLNADLHYQNERQIIYAKKYWSPTSYFSRNYVNKFTLYDPVTKSFVYNLPKGGIMHVGDYDWRTNSFRGNLNFSQNFGDHFVNAIIGSEIRELSATGITRGSVGYKNETGSPVTNINSSTEYPVNPTGTSNLNSIFNLDGSTTGILNRYISYYALVDYSYKNKYDLTFSARRDGTNLFGIRVRDKISPFWSIGGAWDITKETFMNLNGLDLLKIRASIGENGNVYNGSAYLTVKSFNDPLTNENVSFIDNPPNEQLKWERIQIVNIGADFSVLNNRLGGTIEFYTKKGIDLIQQVKLAPQAGFGVAYLNSAKTYTKGFDITLISKILLKPITWTNSILISTLKDKIKSLELRPTSAGEILISDPMYNMTLLEGKSSKSMLSFKWAGLNPQNGNPRGYYNGTISEDYRGIMSNFHSDSLVYHGSGIPTIFGAIRNDFGFKNFSISVNLVYKLKYFFRRSSVNLNYANILSQSMHRDYSDRWQEPGDEEKTSIPSLVYPTDALRNSFYQLSEVLIERGDHIRLQDIRLSYNLSNFKSKRLRFDMIEVYSNLSNIGIIWRENKYKLDPDIPIQSNGQQLPNPFSFTGGVIIKF